MDNQQRFEELCALHNKNTAIQEIMRLEEKIKELEKGFITESDEFQNIILIDGEPAFYTGTKAFTVNNYGDHYRIRIYRKTNGKWTNINNEVKDRCGNII